MEPGAGSRSRGLVRAAWAATALAALVVLLLGLSTRASWHPLIDVDIAVSDELVVPGRGTEVDLLRVLTEWGGAIGRLLVLGPLAGWLAWQRRWRLVAFVIIGGGLVGLFNLLLKAIFNRPRPSYPGTIQVQESSIPSGHSAGAAAVTTVLVLVFWPVLSRGGRGALLLFTAGAAAIVGYTRIALGVHYVSDVVAGWCVGAGWVLVVAVVLRVWPGQPGTLGSER